LTDRNSRVRRTIETACDIYQAVVAIGDNVGFLRKVREIADACGTHIILLDADRLAGREHVEAALRHACRSWEGGEPIANSFEMETLLYAAGTRQCQVGSSFGVHTGENRSYVAVCPPAPGVRDLLAGLVTFVDEDWEALDPAKRARLGDLFGITEKEVAVVGEDRFRDLVLERVALLDVYR
jgi:KEOPS complex subunit Cgi121